MFILVILIVRDVKLRFVHTFYPMIFYPLSLKATDAYAISSC